MPTATRPQFAVLIDAENIPAALADPLFKAIDSRGMAPLRRAYGDFASGRLKSWHEAILRHAIDPRQTTVAGTKNAADISLVIDAMDLMHGGGRLDGFCIVSSDSDFTRLATRIREQGLEIHGFGRATAPPAFRAACMSFHQIEAEAPARPRPPKVLPATPAPNAALPLIRAALDRGADPEGWVSLSALGTELRQLVPGFTARKFGSAKLSSLIRATGQFELDGPCKRVRMRLRLAAAGAA